MSPGPADQTLTTAPGIDLVITVHDAPESDRSGQVPVLLLHGLSQQRHFWDPVVRRLRARPVAAVDQRGHGDSDTPATADFSIPACADDVPIVMDALGWERAVVVGHSWGAWVTLSAAARHPQRVVAGVLVDGGLWSLSDGSSRDELRARLTPPELGIPEEQLWRRIRSGDLGPSWRDEVRAALAPTFVVGSDGLVRTRIGLTRHMRVLDGLLDYDVDPDLDGCERQGVPIWGAVCEPRAPSPDPDRPPDGRASGAGSAARRGNCVVHRWPGAVHDVPLQWPALVAGLVDTVAEGQEGGAR